MTKDDVQLSIEIGIDLFKDLIFASWKAATGWTKKEFPDPFGLATRKYIKGLIDRFNTVKVLGMREPVPLKSLYVRANILEKISARAGLRPEELAEFFDFDRRAFGKKSETVDGERIVNKLDKFIVLGKPGAGKTTYLKFLTLMMLDPLSQIERRRLPIFVTLREWADERIPLMEFIVKQFDICGFEQAQLFVEKMLAEGQCLVLFDGLDEVSRDANQDDIIRQIRNFTDKYGDNQCIISCRVAAYNHWFERFTDVEMADFNEEQMETFIKNWFSGEPKTAAECWERLKNSPPLRELASVPLLLTLLCLEYSESNDFPTNRAELYERAIETLLKKWDESRQVRRDDPYKRLIIKRKKEMFARMAFGMFTENEYLVRKSTLAKMIEKYLEKLPGYDPAELEPDGLDILKAIEAQHGIIVEQAKDWHSFSHLTFLEYFTARFIADKQSQGSLEILVEEHLYDPRWKEVFLVVVGMLDRADELLLLMRRKANEAADLPEINALFQVINKSLMPVQNEYPDVISKNFAFVLVLALAQNYDLAFARLFARDSALAHALARVLDFDLTRAMARDSVTVRALIRNLGLDPDLIDLDPDRDLDPDLGFAPELARALDLDRLEAYVRTNSINEQIVEKSEGYSSANLLILKCLETGCNDTTPIRENLLHEMFLPKGDLEPGGGQ